MVSNRGFVCRASLWRYHPRTRTAGQTPTQANGEAGAQGDESETAEQQEPWKDMPSLTIWLDIKTRESLSGAGAYDTLCSHLGTSAADKMCLNCNAYPVVSC